MQSILGKCGLLSCVAWHVSYFSCPPCCCTLPFLISLLSKGCVSEDVLFILYADFQILFKIPLYTLPYLLMDRLSLLSNISCDVLSLRRPFNILKRRSLAIHLLR